MLNVFILGISKQFFLEFKMNSFLPWMQKEQETLFKKFPNRNAFEIPFRGNSNWIPSWILNGFMLGIQNEFLPSMNSKWTAKFIPERCQTGWILNSLHCVFKNFEFWVFLKYLNFIKKNKKISNAYQMKSTWIPDIFKSAFLTMHRLLKHREIYML